MIGAFGTIMSALRGEVVCEVTTAKVRVWGYFLSFLGVSVGEI